MLKIFCNKQGVLHSLVLFSGFHGIRAHFLHNGRSVASDSPNPQQYGFKASFQETNNLEDDQNSSMPSQLGLARPMLPQMKTMHANFSNKYSTTPIERLISNSPSIIHHIMYSSKKGYADYQKHLKNVDLVFIIDNSGSMQLETDSNSYLKDLNLFGENNSCSITRYHEMTFVFLCMVHVLMNCGVKNIQVRFLNPVSIDYREVDSLTIDPTNDADIQQLYSALLHEPYGTTPLTSNLYESIGKVSKNRHTHYIVFTDGCPYVTKDKMNDCYYANSVDGLQKLLKKYFSPRRIFDFSLFGWKKLTINFISCTNSKDDVAYLDDLDKRSNNIDVTDDLHSEIEQVTSIHGENVAMEIFPRTISAFIYKAMIGCLDSAIDSLDESA